jgi:hypothetical protein
MKSRPLRSTLIVAVVLAIVALPAGAAQARRPPAGMVRDIRVRAERIERAADLVALPYGGGPVLHWNRTHLIFWQPRQSGLIFDPGYQALIESFLRNVARASRSGANVYGLTGQYRDQYGPATYISTYGGAVTAHDPLPRKNGCQEPAGIAPAWSICLTDAQLQREIERVVQRDRLPAGANDLYFLVTPNGLGNCELAGSDICALAGDVTGYCGYHSQSDGGLLYAVIPYNAVPGHCQSNNPRPNGSTADPTISTISHEHSEMITDPLGYGGWVDPNTGEEDGDLCLTSFGPNIGGSGATAWNEEINGGHYYLQEEWSNRGGGCEPRAKPDLVSFQAGLGSPRALSVWLLAHAFDPQGRIVSYRWFFGDGRTSRGRRAAFHRYVRPGHYKVVLRTTDSWGNWAFYAATLTLSRTGGRVVLATNAG